MSPSSLLDLEGVAEAEAKDIADSIDSIWESLTGIEGDETPEMDENI